MVFIAAVSWYISYLTRFMFAMLYGFLSMIEVGAGSVALTGTSGMKSNLKLVCVCARARIVV